MRNLYNLSFWAANSDVGWLVVLRLNVPVNNFSVISGRSHLNSDVTHVKNI